MAATRSRKPTSTKSGQPRGKPPGLASSLLRQVPTEDGTTATTHEVVVRWLRVGADVSVAANKARISRTTVNDWLHDGARLSARIAAGDLEPGDLTPHQAAVLAFAGDALHAVASAEAEAIENVARLARGITRKRTTTTSRLTGDDDAPRVVIQETTTEEELGPNLAANVTLLERRFAERWARRQQIEVTTAETDPDAAPESPLPRLLAALEAAEARRAETAALLEGSGG